MPLTRRAFGLLVLLTASLFACEPKRNYSACFNNLRELLKLQEVYAIRFGGPEKKMPTATGSDFWLELTRTQPPLLDKLELEILVCPWSDKAPAPGFTTYRGPRKPVAELAGGDFVGSCEPGYHDDGSICAIQKNGDVWRVDSKDPQYRAALDATLGPAKK